MNKPIVKYDHPALWTECDTVTEEQYVATTQLIQDLKDTLAGTPNGVGLAAPQIGVTKRVMIIKPHRKLPPRAFVNPEIIECVGHVEQGEEGCLSFPGVFIEVPRHRSVRVRFLDERFKERTELFTHFDARVVQHEVDHLNGVCHVGEAWQQQTVGR